MFGGRSNTIDWWRTISNVEEIVEILTEQDLYSRNFWRNFHCLCCRRVWSSLCEGAKDAVRVAESVVNGDFTDSAEASSALAAVLHQLLEKRSLSYDRIREYLDQIPYELRGLFSGESYIEKLEKGEDLGNESKRLSKEFQQLSETYIQECITYESLSSGIDACIPDFSFPVKVDSPTKVVSWARTAVRSTGKNSDQELEPERFFSCYYEIFKAENQEQFRLLRSLVSEMEIDWWKTIKEPIQIGQILIDQNMFDQKVWRHFHCLSCRRVWPYIRDEAKEGIEIAEKVLNGGFSDEEGQDLLKTVHDRLKKKLDDSFDRMAEIRKFLPDKIAHKNEAYIQSHIEFSSFSCGIGSCRPVYDYPVEPSGAYNLLAWSETRNRAFKNQKNRAISKKHFFKIFFGIIAAEEQEQIKLIRKLFSLDGK